MSTEEKRSELAQAVTLAQPCIKARLNEQEVKIYTLVEAIVTAQIFSWSDDPLVAIYQKLFITQAALCELHFEFEQAGQWQLVSTPVGAKLVARGQEQSKTMALAEQIHSLTPNLAFFGNTDNFFDIQVDDVQRLLEKFWQDFNAHMERDSALEILLLPANATWPQIRMRHRELAAKHHPDRGGDSAVFIRIRQAFESLRVRRGQ